MPEEITAATADATLAPALKSPPADTGKATQGQAPAKGAAANGAVKQPPGAIASGADDPNEVVPQAWPEDWRDRMLSRETKESRDAAKNSLARFKSPEGIWEKVRNLEKALSISYPKKPGEGAEPEQVAEWRQLVGLAETPEQLIEAVKLPDGRTIGEDNKPVVESFVKAMWEDSTPTQVSRALDWYYRQLEENHAVQLETDENYQVEARKALKEEWGPGEFTRNTKHISTLFKDAQEGFMDYMMLARGPDGHRLGDNPEVVKFLSNLATELMPVSTTTLGGSGVPLTERRAQLRALQLTDPDRYYGRAVQDELERIIEAEGRQTARRSA